MSDPKSLGLGPDGYPQIEQRIVQVGRHRWACHTTHGIFTIGEVPLMAWTRDRVERKAARQARKLREQDERNAQAITR